VIRTISHILLYESETTAEKDVRLIAYTNARKLCGDSKHKEVMPYIK